MKNRKLFNSVLSVVLVLSVLFSQFVFGPMTLNASADGENAQAEEVVTWSGFTADFAGGDGTAVSPYLIENADQLYKVVADFHTYEKSFDKHFKLTKDIYIHDVSDGTSIVDLAQKTNWLKAYGNSIATASKTNAFSGTLDGDGYTIYGLYIEDASSAGLFPAISDYAVVKNLNFDNLQIIGTKNGMAGAIAGNGYYYYNKISYSSAKITNCSVTNATMGYDENLESGAGFIGSANDLSAVFTNCYSYNLSISNWGGIPGGLIGKAWNNGSIKLNNCYSIGYFPTNSNVSKAKCTNVYTNVAIPEGNATEGVTVLTDAQMKGEAAKTNLQGFSFKWIWDINKDSYPTVKSDIVEVWDGESRATSFDEFEGTGTMADPYLIENAAQLAYVVATKNLPKKKYYKLVKDIRINDTTIPDWKASAKRWVWEDFRFEGTVFDGNGHTIDGLFFNNYNKDKLGLFSYVGDTTIKNIKFTNASVSKSGGYGAGIVAGQTSASANFENIYIDETCEINAPTTKGVAALSAYSSSSANVTVNIKNCAVLAQIASSSAGSVGAFLGYYPMTADVVNIHNSFSAVEGHKLSGEPPITTSSNTYALVADDYDTTVLTADQMKGENAKTYMPGLSYRFLWETVDNSYPVLNPRGDLWDGTYVSDFSTFKGNGTEESPYEIENGAQLAFALVKNSALNGGYHYKLTKDIVLNDTKVDNWKNSATKWLHQTSLRFVGVLDGDGHNIEGLYMNTSTKRPGLVSYSQGTFKNINFIGASINYTGTSEPGVAIVAAQTSGPTDFEKIYIDETSEINATAVKGVAGLAGRGYDSTGNINITNCAVLATINTEGTECGALAGSHWASSGATVSIQNSYSASNKPLFGGSITLSNSYNNYSVVEDEDGTTLLTADQMKGENAKTYMSELSFGRHWKVVENGYPVPKIYITPEGIWDGTIVSGYSDFKGSGTEADPYLIENGSQLAFAVSKNPNLADGSYYKLVNDIKLNDTNYSNWTKDATPWIWNNHARFNGTLDGDGYTIDGLYINSSDTRGRIGLIAYIGKVKDNNKIAEVKNIKFTNASVNSSVSASGAAIVAGQTSGAANFENLYIDETCEINAPNVQGVAAIAGRGYDKGNAACPTITNCAVLAKINGGSNSGSFVGDYWAADAVITIKNSFANTSLGLVGKKGEGALNILNSYATVVNDVDTGATQIDADKMKGLAAAENMSALDFYCIWEAVENGYPVIRKNTLSAWNGAPEDLSAVSYAGGTGTKNDPYQIENGDQLYKMVAENSNADISVAPETQTYFEIIADINLGSNQWYAPSVSSWITNAPYDTIGFNGVIYGNGHTIYNLYSNVVAGAAGLIPVATQSTKIYDLHLVGGYLPRKNYQSFALGGFIGLAKGVAGSNPILIEGCSVNNFNIAGVNGAAAIIGYTYSQSLYIKDSYVVDSSFVIDAGVSAALVGTMNGSEYNNSFVIENCYTDSYATPVASDKFMAATTFKNVYTTYSEYDNSIEGLTKVTAAEITGDVAKETFNSFNFNQLWKTVEGKYPVHKTLEEKATAWDGTIARAFAGGDGSAENPYLISNAKELYLLANSDTESTKGNYYKLTNDISISNVYDNWTNENPYSWFGKKVYLDGFKYYNSFAGVLDGANYTIRGLYIEDTVSEEGTFAYGILPFVTAEAIIKNLNVENVSMSVEGDAYVGAVAGIAHVSIDDTVNSLNHIYFLDVNVENAPILGGATRCVSFNRCEGETLDTNPEIRVFNIDTNKGLTFDSDALIYTSSNVDEQLLNTVRLAILNGGSIDCVDINGVEGLDIADLVAVNEALTYVIPEEHLVWSDEFNGEQLNKSVWSQSSSSMSTGDTLKYTDTATFNGDSISLNCIKTEDVDANGDPIYNINYGLNTSKTMSYKYGRLEMRAKIPFGAGAFPALWLSSRGAIGYDENSEFSTEVDVFEVFGKEPQNDKMITCIHKWYNKDGEKTGDECSCGTGILAGNGYKVEEDERDWIISGSAQNEWHTIVFDWTEDTMTFSVDGNVFFTAKRSQMDRFDLSGYDTDSDGIFNQFMYPIITNHMYTTGEGAAHKFNGTEDQIDASKLTYEIDYIRLYQKNDGKSQINLK